MEEYIKQLVEELKTILANLKKTPNRSYKKETLERKFKETTRIKEEFEELISETAGNPDFVGINIEFQQIFKTIKLILQEKVKMSTSDFKIETALKVIPDFTGNYKELEGFLVITKILNDSLNDAGKAELLQFIIHVKLSKNVKTAIGSHSVPQTYAALVNSLKEKYKSNLTLSQVLNRLANIAQRNSSIVSYKEIILNTINELTQIQIEQLGDNATTEQKKAISSTNELQALQIFKSGLNDYIRPTVIAARPKTIAEAINIALEVETNDQTKEIRHFQVNRNNPRQNYNHNRRFNNNNNFTRQYQTNNNYRNNNNNNYRQYQQQNNNRYQQNNGYQQHNNSRQIQHNNYHNYQNRNPQINNYNNNNRNQQTGNRPQRVHITQQENCQGPDQEDPESQ